MRWHQRRKLKPELEPDEIFLDSTNLPSFNNQQFEGRIEQPISKRAFYWLGLLGLLIALGLLFKVINLQVWQGEALAARSQTNTLHQIPIFAERGIITDRLGTELAWNDNGRQYLNQPGFGHLLGYIGYPNETELATGDHHPQEMIGRDGAEKAFNDLLRGKRGTKIEEIDVHGQIQSDHILVPPATGTNLKLSIDARLQSQLFHYLTELIDEGRFKAGAAVMMDVRTGELLAMTSAPEYEPAILTAGTDRSGINQLLTDSRHPFLNRVIDGLYTPGSIVKPIMALGALTEGIIDPAKKILSTGSLTVPNPYFPDQPSIFNDWKAHGWVDMRQALAVSSNVYFYTIGGGFGDQAGLGINKIVDYAKLLGLGQPTGINFLTEEAGVIPTPAWKAANFHGEDWRLGDTYHTVIGQYGFQVTPLQMVREVAAIANSGQLLTPTVLAGQAPQATTINRIKPMAFQVVREGMRQGALVGTGTGLNVPYVEIATKTGTAELGVSKGNVNSWVTGFFPYQQPHYAFAVVLEQGSRSNVIGGVYVMRQLFDWMNSHTPEYFQ